MKKNEQVDSNTGEVVSSAIDPAILEQVLATGNIGALTTPQRVHYYTAICERLGLNPLTRPFEYLFLNGKVTLYARRDATDQLRAIRQISITIVARERVGDVWVVTARASTPNGRCDESIGAVTIGSLKGDALANAIMKAETKAKRRVTLSICGLGWTDESEIETIPGAKIIIGDNPVVGHGDPTAGQSDESQVSSAERLQEKLDEIAGLSEGELEQHYGGEEARRKALGKQITADFSKGGGDGKAALVAIAAKVLERRDHFAQVRAKLEAAKPEPEPETKPEPEPEHEAAPDDAEFQEMLETPNPEPPPLPPPFYTLEEVEDVCFKTPDLEVIRSVRSSMAFHRTRYDREEMLALVEKLNKRETKLQSEPKPDADDKEFDEILETPLEPPFDTLERLHGFSQS